MKDNTLRRTAIISLVVAAIFAVMIFVPEAAGIDGFDGGFAFSFVSLLIALTAGGVSIFYFKQAQKLNSIFCGEGVLAHWIYSSEYWKNYTRKEYLTEIRLSHFFSVSYFGHSTLKQASTCFL